MRFFDRASTFAARRVRRAVLAGLLGLMPIAAFADYRLQPGDTLEVSVTGVAALKQRSQIGMEGKIAVPLLGSVKVAGLPLAAAEAKIAQDLANKVFHEEGGDGRDIPRLILAGDVIVTIAEYRPVYVSGDVAKPGEYQFRPGITVRQAVSLAGGYGPARFGTDPYVQAADLRGEYEALRVELARERARAMRLRGDLGEPTAADGAPPPAGDRFAKAEAAQREARLADREKDTAFLRAAIDKANLQINMLAEQKKADQDGNRADVADYEKLRELSRRGLVTFTRLSEARRVALLSSNDLLRTIVDLANIERQRGDYMRELAKLDGQQRVQDLKELQDTEVRLAQLSARLKSTGEKLAYTGALKWQLADGAAGSPTVTVHRRGDGGAQRLAAIDEDLELAPGDVVDVALKNDRVAHAGKAPATLAAAR